jgi:hypothetical protein
LNFERATLKASNFKRPSSKEKTNKQTKRGKKREGRKEGRKEGKREEGPRQPVKKK